MHVDQARKEVAVKLVYASEHAGALDEVSALAAQAKLGTASSIVSRLDDAVRTFELHMPQLAVRGYAIQLKIVGVSLDKLGASDGSGVEKTLFAADASIVIADNRATLDRVGALLAAAGTTGPMAVVSETPVDGVDPAMLAATGRAGLQVVLKPLIAELGKRLESES
jgi:hypothetical protein